MSRSRKKPYASWVCYFSNKRDKRLANQAFRAKNKHIIKKLIKDIDSEHNFYHRTREVSDTYDFASDGLPQYVGNTRLAKSKDPKDKELFRKWISK